MTSTIGWMNVISGSPYFCRGKLEVALIPKFELLILHCAKESLVLALPMKLESAGFPGQNQFLSEIGATIAPPIVSNDRTGSTNHCRPILPAEGNSITKDLGVSKGFLNYRLHNLCARYGHPRRHCGKLKRFAEQLSICSAAPS